MISICMIVRDESKVLAKCLESIKDYNFEIVIVDTGSIDNTKEIARRYTKNVYDFKWCNDFSKAINFSISKANNKYVLVLAADEIVINLDKEQLGKKILDRANEVGRINIKNEYLRNGNKFVYTDYVSRVFDKDKYEYNGCIHEQIVRKDGNGYKTYKLPVTINHLGYDNDEISRKNKISRNIQLLKASLMSNDSDPYIYYQLGKSYYMDGNYNEAKINFEKALGFNLDTKYEYVQDLVESYGYSLINIGEYKESIKLLNLYEEFKNSADYIFLAGLIYMNNGLFIEAITEFQNSKKIEICKMEGVNDYLANYNIGVIFECLGNKEKAVEFYYMCKNYDKALERISFLEK
ncbi:glycosyltransferase [Clostridium sartagoforme]|jgi:glycosyltransferase involved in cell wall biosynthesis|uniref:glycosyltransferase n=1 Tax=Clostridium sartagoforme TaxID=84031 RepID=UPI0031E4595A